MFVVAWGEFELTLEDILNLMGLSLYGDNNSISVSFKEGDEDKLQRLITYIDHSKTTSSSKSIYASWIRHFDEGDGS